MKRFICAALVLITLCTAFAAQAAFDPSASIGTKFVVLMDADSGAVLWSQRGDERAYPASTTKILTCILALENGNLDETITVGREVERGFSSKSSLMGLSPGETLTLRDLIYGIMLVSGNDAAAAIAVHIGGSTEGFADLMNAKAADLGMENSHFVNPHGVQKEDHYTTALDMAKLMSYTVKNKDFRAIIAKRTYEIPPTNRNRRGYQLENTNKLVHTKPEADSSMEYRYALGGKTGDTDAAGRCLVAAAEKDGTTLVSVQLNDPDANRRFSLAAELFNWGFANFASIDAIELDLADTVEVPVKNCSFDDETGGLLTLKVDLSNKRISQLADEIERIKQNPSAITTSIITEGELTAPIAKGDLLAKVSYLFEGATLFTADAYAIRDVEKMGGGVLKTHAPAPTIEEAIPRKSKGPWLFYGLVAAAVLLLAGLAVFLKNRRGSRRKRVRRTHFYSGRR